MLMAEPVADLSSASRGRCPSGGVDFSIDMIFSTPFSSMTSGSNPPFQRPIARGQDVLFHGTRHRERVLESGFLRPSPASQAVALSRSPRVAAHFATLPRDDDEGAGAILVFDRSSLKTQYKLECIADGWVADPSEFNEFSRAEHDEFEEHVFARDVEIAPHLVLDGIAFKAQVAHAQLCHSRMPYIRAYPRQSQEMMFDVHARAFAFWGGA